MFINLLTAQCCINCSPTFDKNHDCLPGLTFRFFNLVDLNSDDVSKDTKLRKLSLLIQVFCRTLDSGGSGFLVFKEFIMANKLVSATDPQDKLLWAFRV